MPCVREEAMRLRSIKLLFGGLKGRLSWFSLLVVFVLFLYEEVSHISQMSASWSFDSEGEQMENIHDQLCAAVFHGYYIVSFCACTCVILPFFPPFFYVGVMFMQTFCSCASPFINNANATQEQSVCLMYIQVAGHKWGQVVPLDSCFQLRLIYFWIK